MSAATAQLHARTASAGANYPYQAKTLCAFVLCVDWSLAALHRLSLCCCTNAGQNRLVALNYIYQGEDTAVCAAHAAWGEAFQALHAAHMLRYCAFDTLLAVSCCFLCLLLHTAGHNRLLALNYIFQGEDAAMCAAHAAWGEAFQALHAEHLLRYCAF
jgi:hypothetical protein